MTPNQFKRIQKKLNLCPTEMARAMGVSYQTVKDYRAGRRNITNQSIKQLGYMLTLKDMGIDLLIFIKK